MRKIAHLTSVHPRYDTRIFIKQCRSLARHGYDVTEVVADGLGDECKDGVAILDVGRPRGRASRLLHSTAAVYERAMDSGAEIFHLHDPELIPVGLRIKRQGGIVVFDSHEDVPLQILGKPYLGPLSRRFLSGLVRAYERRACGRLDGIVAATPFIRQKFGEINPNTVDVKNYPVLSELSLDMPWADKALEVCYVGDISAMRGIREIVRACEHLESGARLNLGGRFSDAALESEVKAYSGWGRVNALGYLSRVQVRDVLARSMVGLVVLHPAPNYLDALPVKMFEYMAAGIPVIASDIPLWRGIVESSRCGLCVNPYDPMEIAAAIDRMIADPQAARVMGENGRRAAFEEYNWEPEEKALLHFYANLH